MLAIPSRSLKFRIWRGIVIDAAAPCVSQAIHSHPTAARPRGSASAGLCHHCFDFSIENRGINSFEPMANYSLRIDQQNRGEALDAIEASDLVRISVEKRTPIEFLVFDRLADFFQFIAGVDADQGERSSSVLVDERPLVVEQCDTRWSPQTPKIQHHDFAAIIGQLKRRAVDIDAGDIWSRLSDRRTSGTAQAGSARSGRWICLATC